ncbi:MAG: MFS transporter [Brevundimonas sp.]|uniref:MFS transporter n=1 Tax=Brevundimonas sp. TaxID=1871086 RepID=UPI002AB98A83|nr:MFS transporter [Brevundimonas sp.]MDZ4112886.1 MFS transporter [Brevundimonas sp.]
MTSAPSPAKRLPNRTLAAFSAACLPYAALGLPVYVTLPEFYASHVGVDLALVGLIFLVIRLADIVVDPALGMVIDRTHSRFGRYRLWMGMAAPVLMLAVGMLFMVSPGAGGAYLAVWLIVMSLGFSVSLLSQVSWASTLTSDYDQRSRIYGWWQTANIVGVLVVLLIPALVQNLGLGDYASAVRWQGWFIIVALPLTLAITFAFTPEPKAGPSPDKGGRFAYLALFKLPVMRRLLTADLMLGIARGVVGALFFYFFEAVQGFQRAETSILLLVYFVAGLAGAPLWSALAVRMGKHGALILACVYFAATLLLAAFAGPVLVPLAEAAGLGNAEVVVAGLMVALVGLAFASGDLLLRAMMADVADQVRLEQGEDRTGLLFSILTATSKLGYAVSVMTFAGLRLTGFDPTLGGANSETALIWLQAMFAGLPALCLVVGAWALWRYPLDQKRHAEIRAALEARGGAG